MILRFAAIVLALACTASSAAGQLTQVQPGTRIRVTQPVFVDGIPINEIHRPQVATLVSIDSASITALLERGDTLLTLPFSAIRRLQISQGAQSANRGRIQGMLKGALIGAGFGAVIHYAAKRTGALEECELSNDPAIVQTCRYTGPHVGLTVAGAAIGGAAIGFGFGSRQREAWQEVLPESLRMVPGPSDLSLNVSLRF
ncbi:hypothetical protein [Longimicrobium sp.]|uniref:hypothetical protein n=1 Tax=Longimicrobium sp. TaxID=2029185 RepID=UPI002F93E5F9